MTSGETVAIIGGGVAGLSAGALLSRKGLRVRLFEANAKPGGCCAQTDLAGYTLNDGAVFAALPAIFDHVFERLGLDRASLLPLRKITANQTTTLPDGTVVTIGDGREVSVDGGSRRVDAGTIQAELDGLLARWTPVLRLFRDDLLLRPFSSSRLLRKGWRHVHKLRGTVASEMTRLFSDGALRAAMAGLLLYTGVPPERMPALATLGLAALLAEGFHLPEGGMGRIPEALRDALERNGGELSLESPVDRIVVKNGRVCGVDAGAQGFVEADAVVSTVTGMATFDALMDHDDVPHGMRRKVRGAPLSQQAMSVQLGLANRIDVASYANSVLPMMEDQHKLFAPDGDGVEWLGYTVPTVTMPELAPPGGSIVEMFVPIRQDRPVDDWDEPTTRRVADSAIAMLSRLHDVDIVIERVRGPRDFRDSLRLYRGAVYGLSPAADPSALFPHDPRVPGLFLAGQTTYPGYGVGPSMMSGIFAADALLRSMS